MTHELTIDPPEPMPQRPAPVDGAASEQLGEELAATLRAQPTQQHGS